MYISKRDIGATGETLAGRRARLVRDLDLENGATTEEAAGTKAEEEGGGGANCKWWRASIGGNAGGDASGSIDVRDMDDKGVEAKEMVAGLLFSTMTHAALLPLRSGRIPSLRARQR